MNLLSYEQSILKVGKVYTVPHAILERLNGQVSKVPINPFKHKDPQFGADFYHYHIDGRFSMDSWARRHFAIERGLTNHAIHDTGYYVMKGIVHIDKRCIRLTTGTKPPLANWKGEISKWAKWKETMVGKSCAGRKCPHLGTTMIEINGKLICHLHALEGDLQTEVII